MIVILHNIRSAKNVGSIFRTADAAGVKKLYLTGYTPLPIDRFGRKRKDVLKTALGAEEIPWEQVENISTLLRRLKNVGFYIIAIEQSPDAIDYRKVKPKRKTAFIFGNEVRGLSKSVLSKADVVAQIPMHGKKESLNVAVAAGIVLFHVC